MFDTCVAKADVDDEACATNDDAATDGFTAEVQAGEVADDKQDGSGAICVVMITEAATTPVMDTRVD